MAGLADFMISRVRVKLLKIFFDNPQEMYYVRELTRKAEEEINAIRRELGRMDKSGLVKSEKRGNRLYYYPNKKYRYFHELLMLVSKSIGLGAKLIKNQKKLGKVKYAMMSGKFAKRIDRDESDVDLLIVGSVVMPELALLVQTEEKRLNTEINYTVMTQDEFEFRKNRRDPFLQQILANSRIMIIGDEDALVEKSTIEEQS